MILMVDWCLSCSPFSVGIGNRWVLGENSGNVPVEEVWIVDQSLGVNTMVVHNNWSVVLETSTETSDHEVHNPSVSDPASDIEILDG